MSAPHASDSGRLSAGSRELGVALGAVLGEPGHPGHCGGEDRHHACLAGEQREGAPGSSR